MDAEPHVRLSHLRSQLLNAGYHGFQIDDMIYDAVGTRDVTHLDGSKIDQLIEALTEHCEFASKCRSSKNSK